MTELTCVDLHPHHEESNGASNYGSGFESSSNVIHLSVSGGASMPYPPHPNPQLRPYYHHTGEEFIMPPYVHEGPFISPPPNYFLLPYYHYPSWQSASSPPVNQFHHWPAPFMVSKVSSSTVKQLHGPRQESRSYSRDYYSTDHSHHSGGHSLEANSLERPGGHPIFTLSGNVSADVKRVHLFIKRNPGATLFSINGIIAEVAKEQDGSRFIQKRLKLGSDEEKRLALTAALPLLNVLWNDAYGNFMLQGIFEHGTNDMKRDLKDAIQHEKVVSLSLQIYGCRVIQKAIECLDEDNVSDLISHFRDQVLTFIHDPNGNHVIQKSIQVMSAFAKSATARGEHDMAADLSERLQFVINDVVSNVESLSRHRYGCRVVQRALEYCVEKQKNAVLEEVIACHKTLVDDQYGNYVIQQALVCCSDSQQGSILKTLTENGSFLRLSKHKYASNVVEAMLKHGKPEHRKLLSEELLKVSASSESSTGSCCVVEMAQDPIANYVVKSALDSICDVKQREKLVEELSSNRDELAKSPFAKYIVAKISKRDNPEPVNSSQ